MTIHDSDTHYAERYKTSTDLFRFIRNRSNGTPNYSLFLGAGCSVSSKIESGQQLISRWKKELYDDFCENKLENPSPEDIKRFLEEKHLTTDENEYAFYFEKRYPLKRQRINFIENQIDNECVCPSIGYACLVDISKEYIDSFFTTNFDDLLNEAFYIYDNNRKKPFVSSHATNDCLISLASKRTKIIKLHGDYLYGEMKMLQDETEELSSSRVELLSAFAKERGLIVLGYSGNDNSIMGALTKIIEDESNYQYGLFWCLREGETLPTKLGELIRLDENKGERRVFIVRISGFDEFAFDLYEYLHKDESQNHGASNLPDPVRNASPEIRNKLQKNYSNYTEDNNLGKYLIRFRQETSRQKRNIDEDGEYQISADGKIRKYGDITNAIREKDFTKALNIIEEKLAGSDLVERSRIYLLRLKAECLFYLDKRSEALISLRELLAQNRYNITDYLNAWLCETDNRKRLDIADSGLNYFPASTELIFRKANSLIDLDLEDVYKSQEKASHPNQNIITLLMNGFKKAKTIGNKCWQLLFDYSMHYAKKNEDWGICNELIDYFNEIDSRDSEVLSRQARLYIFRDKKEKTEVYDLIKSKRIEAKQFEFDYDSILLDTASEFSDYDYALDFCKKEYEYNSLRCVLRKIKAIYINLRDLEFAYALIQKVIADYVTKDLVEMAVSLALAMGNGNRAEELIQEYGLDRSSYLDRIAICNSDYAYLEQYYREKASAEEPKSSTIVGLSHSLLMQGKFDEAIKECKQYLDSIGTNYSGILAINYYLAKQELSERSRPKNEKNINAMADSNDDEFLTAAACYLNGSEELKKKGDEIIRKRLEKDYSAIEYLKECYIFQKRLLNNEDDFRKRILCKLKPITFSERDKEIISSNLLKNL